MKNRTVKLGDILGYEQPTKYIVNSTNYSDEYDIPVLTAGQSFILGYTNETDGIYTDLPVIIFDDFTTATKYVDFPFKVKSSAMKILKADNSIADDRYMFYQMQLIQANNDEHKRYWISKYSQFPINLPPLETQKKIAAILDAADAYRQKTKALIAKYDELTQSLFLDMFGDPVRNEKGWEKLDLKKLCSFKKDSIKPEDILDGVKYIALDSIQKKTGEIIEVYTPSANEIKSNKFKFDERFILYGKLRPYLNKVALPSFEGICSTDIIPLRPIEGKSNRSYISQLMKGSWFVSYANERVSGANLPRISPSEIEKFQAINPPIDLQNQFAERVQKIEIQKAHAQQSLEKAEELFSSLLQKAFKGEIE